MSELLGHETPEILQTRQAMLDAGWIYAIDDFPGVFVPCPTLPKTDWSVPPERLVAFIKEHCDDPEFAKELISDIT